MIAGLTGLLSKLCATLAKMEVALGAIQEAIVWTNETGVVQWSNAAFEQLVGRDRLALFGTPLTDVLPLRQEGALLPLERHPVHLALHQRSQAIDRYEFSQPNQGIVLEISWAYIQVDTSEGNAILTIRDITQYQDAEAELRESQERYELALYGANDGLWDWKLKENKVYFSPRWKLMLGWQEHDIGDAPQEWFNRIHPDDIQPVKLALAKHVKGMTAHFQSEYRIVHRDGTYHWMLSRGLAVRDATGRAYRIAGSQTDITERKQAEQQLQYDAFHDALTGLPNRALFRDRLEHAVKSSERRSSYIFAVLFLDLDRFKVINDSLGHLIGDQLLIEIAFRLKLCLRPRDTVARLGGDEFAILLEDIQAVQDVTDIAERIQQEFRVPFYLNEQEIFTSVSIGIRFHEGGYQKIDDLLRDADIALYQAKALGKARYAIFDESMHLHAVTLLQLENDLRRAIERQELFLQYQPIMALGKKELIGFEALVRWQHPEYGLISPAEFIPIAEDSGMIVEIGNWVLKQACQQVKQWQASFPSRAPLTISINLSAKQFSQPHLLQQIDLILEEVGFDAKCLKLEITESAILENPDAAVGILQQLRERGICIAIDDFGTGYSSLGYLHRLPIDTLKIDRSFINSIDINLEKLELVRSIISLAWNLGMDIVAEGIETQEQLTQLKFLRCDFGQGYLFAKPLDQEAVEVLLAHDHN